MNEELLVLRQVESANHFKNRVDLGGGPLRPERAFDLELVQAGTGALPSIRGQRDVLAAAESVPLKLHLPRRRGSTAATLADVWGRKAIGADDTTLSGSGATVAVLDTGIDIDHEAFDGMRDRIVQRDFTGEGNSDSDGHGTHCAGTLFGGRVGGVSIGIAPGISRALIGKVIGSQGASSATLAQAIDWAIAEGANVISMSVGIDFPGDVRQRITAGYPVELATSQALKAYCDTLDFFAAIAQRASLTGWPVVFVAAAGNASRFDQNARYVISVEPPAAARGFVAVGALGRRPTGHYYVAPFSNSGARLCGPGVEVISARAGHRSGLETMDGTSMATPHVAGVAALWFEKLSDSHGPYFPAELFLDKLVGSARDEAIERERLLDAGQGMIQAPAE